MNRLSLLGKALILLLATPALAGAQSAIPLENTVRDVQQYGFAIHILAMLLVGFGFLMVFVKRYGYGAITGTYLVVAAGIPVYVGLRSSGVLSAEAVDRAHDPGPAARRVCRRLGAHRHRRRARPRAAASVRAARHRS